MNKYLFIYAVQREIRDQSPGFCTVLAYGASRESAEAVAINCVHQSRLHILRADTVTEAEWLDEVEDGPLLSDLALYGVAMQMSA